MGEWADAQREETTMSAKDKPHHAPVPDEVKQRMRAALDAKRSHAGRDVSADDNDRSKVSGQGHGREASQQMFRRKAGS